MKIATRKKETLNSKTLNRVAKSPLKAAMCHFLMALSSGTFEKEQKIELFVRPRVSKLSHIALLR